MIEVTEKREKQFKPVTMKITTVEDLERMKDAMAQFSGRHCLNRGLDFCKAEHALTVLLDGYGILWKRDNMIEADIDKASSIEFIQTGIGYELLSIRGDDMIAKIIILIILGMWCAWMFYIVLIRKWAVLTHAQELWKATYYLSIFSVCIVTCVSSSPSIFS